MEKLKLQFIGSQNETRIKHRNWRVRARTHAEKKEGKKKRKTEKREKVSGVLCLCYRLVSTVNLVINLTLNGVK